ncbi:hypothetical protein GCM10011517_05360 [Actibacterium pelagium]|uniref:Bacteriophage phiJL001 Gp84 C-terminal domain-containing protein n=1 Tax=Actibacterium pelagium TaxID=2029103 RepID=A0A917ABM1_9RHOB|nr:hypothetical protein GCM10011517_05360 [Actibacterium pelagium]
MIGFTDHDSDLSFEGVTFNADSGMTARSLRQSSGLSVDNTEVLGALNHASVREEDIAAGRYDGAEVVAWLVNWANAEERLLQFRGSIGEITRQGTSFTAELRGLAEALNRPVGRIYHADCSAVLGDQACGFDLSQPGYAVETTLEAVEENRIFRFSSLPEFEVQWFQKGTLEVLDGEASGLKGVIQNDQMTENGRLVSLWDALRVPVLVGSKVRLTAGCDRRADTCRLKFNNFLNFRGFPHIPGDDWMMAYPRQGQNNNGGSLR